MKAILEDNPIKETTNKIILLLYLILVIKTSL